MKEYDKYCIEVGYKTNEREYELDLTKQPAAESAANQRHVFEAAKKIVDERGYNKILDVGAGDGYKLMEFFSDKDTLGIEVGKNYEFLLKKYPERRWMLADYTVPLGEQFDIVICADVIEHVMDPDVIMRYVADMSPDCIIFSTPARELLPEWYNAMPGPPINGGHIREWTAEEFINYVNKYFPLYKTTHTLQPVGVMTISIKND